MMIHKDSVTRNDHNNELEMKKGVHEINMIELD